MQITRFKKSTSIIVGILILILLIAAIYSYFKLYLPDLPLDGVTKRQAYEKIFNSHNAIVFLADQGDYNWYIYNGPQKEGGTELIKRMKTLGFIFIEQMGSGYIFSKENTQDKIVVTSQQWTSKYILYKAPYEVKLTSAARLQ
ncbi:type II toxin-antitoxin system HicA family toxin [Paenibacillus sp. V4I5]|uniref:type II toxin-antitoxin system HicA family toxin n=1 Tax=Paenibacillus sp. V4I5 TaxID=3042306 RepID=UPI002791BAA6|nr:type II toxin-antitoxin system HicA family toxin [Paenibacillus sp. V4I5]MDQ0914966.1 hypothetical protein [Paenibacillus sp. V4I5]